LFVYRLVEGENPPKRIPERF